MSVEREGDGREHAKAPGERKRRDLAPVNPRRASCSRTGAAAFDLGSAMTSDASSTRNEPNRGGESNGGGDRDAPPAPRMLLDALQVGESLASLGLCGRDSPVAEARIVAIADDVGLSLLLSLGGEGAAAVTVEVAPRASTRPAVAQTAAFSLSYRARGDLAPRLGEAICQAVAVAVAKAEVEFLAAIARAPAGDGRGVTLRRGGPLLVRVDAEGGSFDALSPYAGCSIGCGFCYASERVGAWWRLRTGGHAAWGSWIEARADAAEVLRAELVGRPRRPIKFTPIASDPWVGVERRLRLTRACLQVLAEAEPMVDVVALTRSPRVLDDLEVLATVPGMRVGVSLPTIDDAVRARFEPRAASVQERLTILERLRDAGIRTFAVVQPMLPGSLEGLADAIAARASSASLDVLHGVYDAADDFTGPYAEVATDSWQQARIQATADALRARGVAVWGGELPPDLAENDAD